MGCNYNDYLAVEIGCAERIKTFLHRQGWKIHSHTGIIALNWSLTSISYFTACSPPHPRGFSSLAGRCHVLAGQNHRRCRRWSSGVPGFGSCVPYPSTLPGRGTDACWKTEASWGAGTLLGTYLKKAGWFFLFMIRKEKENETKPL